MTYAQAIMEAASISGVSPFCLASSIIQEQGTKGTSNSISGTVDGYRGYYNYYNWGAYASGGNSAVMAEPVNGVAAEAVGMNELVCGQPTVFHRLPKGVIDDHIASPVLSVAQSPDIEHFPNMDCIMRGRCGYGVSKQILRLLVRRLLRIAGSGHPGMLSGSYIWNSRRRIWTKQEKTLCGTWEKDKIPPANRAQPVIIRGPSALDSPVFCIYEVSST